MSRSFKKSAIMGITNARSEKAHKRAENHRERVAERSALAHVKASIDGDGDADGVGLGAKLVCGQWGPKDGKQYFRTPAHFTGRQKAKVEGK